jgi:hypothetical protein
MTNICEQINILTGSSVSIDELVNLLSKEIDVVVNKTYSDLPKGDPEQSLGTTDKMLRLLGTDLEGMEQISNGLHKTIKFLRS